jgi:hypothetical protein
MTNKFTLQYICRVDEVLRATTFGGQSLAESTIKYFEEFEVNTRYLKSKVSELLGSLRSAAGAPDPSEQAGDPSEQAGDPAGQAGDPAGQAGDPLDRISELGRDLYRELVPSSLRAKLSTAVGGNLLLAIDSSLAWIPWELLHDGTNFFCRHYNMGRIVTVPVAGRSIERRELAPPVRHLVITDPEGDLPAAAEEGVSTRDLLLELGDRVRPTLLSGRVGGTGFIDGLRKTDVFHFAGHLEGEEDETLIRLSGGGCTPGQIRKLAGRFPFPALVFLNGCRSSSLDAPLRIEAGQRRAFGLASTFLECGVGHFVGTLWDVRDDLASSAGVLFFRSLYSGKSVGAALKETRGRLADEFGQVSMGWACLVLYGDPTFTIPGLGETAEDLLDDMNAVESRRSALLVNLESSRRQDRFLAAAGLFQLGDRTGVGTLKLDREVLYTLLESGSVETRQRGETVVRILCGSSMGYGADLDQRERSLAVERIIEWWETPEARTRLSG